MSFKEPLHGYSLALHYYGYYFYARCYASIVLCSCWVAALGCIWHDLPPLPESHLSISWSQARSIDFLVRIYVNTPSTFAIFMSSMALSSESIPMRCTSPPLNSTTHCTPQPNTRTSGIGLRGCSAWMDLHSQRVTTIDIARGGPL